MWLFMFSIWVGIWVSLVSLLVYGRLLVIVLLVSWCILCVLCEVLLCCVKFIVMLVVCRCVVLFRVVLSWLKLVGRLFSVLMNIGIWVWVSCGVRC